MARTTMPDAVATELRALETAILAAMADADAAVAPAAG